MAQSRLEKIGTIFSRLQGLRKSGAIKAEQVYLKIVTWVVFISKLQVPIWAEVYEAFPPRYEPRWDAKDPVVPVRKILYREDSVRAQYSKVVPSMLFMQYVVVCTLNILAIISWEVDFISCLQGVWR